MKNIESLWHKITTDQSLIDAIFSNVRKKNETDYTQVKIKPILIKDELHYHLEYVFNTKVTHENLKDEDFITRMMELSTIMKQINIYTSDHDYQVLMSKKMKVTIIKKAPTKHEEEVILSHNRKNSISSKRVYPFLFLWNSAL